MVLPNILLKFLVGERFLFVEPLPPVVLLEVVLLRLRYELVVIYEPVPVGVDLGENRLPHTLHILGSLAHVVLGRPRRVHLIELLDEQRLYLDLVPQAVRVQIVHHEEGFRVEVLLHVVLLLPHLLELLLVAGLVQLVVLLVLVFYVLNVNFKIAHLYVTSIFVELPSFELNLTKLRFYAVDI